ncbi:hypothetical protein DFH11DRAFT_1549790 [Phellopilus nigrolimitatus]|nr:hypothetical protein DFH11DRAFT_1549790 [Phellopilus nigrolimitatus]
MKYNLKTYADRVSRRLVKDRRRRRANNLTAAQRYEIAKRSAEKASKIQKVCEMYWALGEDYVEKLAELGMKKPAARRRLQRLSKYGFQREPNKYNAFLHIKSLEINPDLPEGQKKRLSELQEVARSVDWDTFSRDKRNEQEIEDMKAAVLLYRQTKNKGSRSQPKAQARDARMTMDRVDSEIIALASRSEVSSMRVTVRRRPGQSVRPSYCVDAISKKFVEVCLGIVWDDFVLRYEAYSVSGLAGVAQKENGRKTILKRSIWNSMRMSLRRASGDAEAEMSWLNYDKDIVQKYGIELVGWPVQPIGPIDNLPLKQLQTISDTFSDNLISWIRLTEEELSKRPGGEARAHKTRSDKGQKRGPRAKKNTARNDAAQASETPMDEDT